MPEPRPDKILLAGAGAMALPDPAGQVMRAADLGAARNLWRQEDPDVIVADAAVADALLAEVSLEPDAPPVIVLGSGDRAGAFASLPDAGELAVWLRAALRVRTLQRETRQAQKTSQDQMLQQERMAALGALVAGIAHEMHTPIGTITSNTDVLSRSLGRLRDLMKGEGPEPNPDLKRVFQVVEEISRVNSMACDRIVGIVRSLRNFARLDEADLRKYNLEEGLESTLTLVHHELKSRITVTKEFGHIPPVDCHPNQINQVFLNMLVNASHAIQGKGTITLRTQQAGDKVTIQIADSGSGIRPEHLTRIFEMGFTTKGEGAGTGLGLAISHKIIQDHKGRIDVESEAGKGTTFTITLPIEWKTP